MKKAAFLLLGLAIVSVISIQSNANVSAHPLVAAALQGRSSISGYVFDATRRPLPDVYVELMDDVYGSVGRRRTDASGRYLFQGLAEGRYKVKVLPYGTNYREEVRDVSLTNISPIPGTGAVSEQQDFYLRLKPNANTGPLAEGPPGVLFAQAVPDAAKKLYQQGISALGDKKDKEAFESLKHSLEIFPEYYDALDRLGREYVARGYHEAGYILLTKAIEVNRGSFSSLAGLGIAQYHLKLYDKAVETLQRAASIYNKSVDVQVYLGKGLRRMGKPAEAEVALKHANELSRGKSAEVYWQLAALYSEQQRYREAADALELFLKNQHDARDAAKIRETIRVLREKSGVAKATAH
jgi:tetratricopeptide (TPR) repeat protein